MEETRLPAERELESILGLEEGADKLDVKRGKLEETWGEYATKHGLTMKQLQQARMDFLQSEGYDDAGNEYPTLDAWLARKPIKESRDPYAGGRGAGQYGYEEQPTGMGCSCKNIDPLFLQVIENYISGSVSDLGERSPLLQELRDKLAALANGCGYERLFAGNWVRWPKQDALLNKLGSYSVIKEHDDGDLTIDTSDGKAVVTTEGEIFYEKK